MTFGGQIYKFELKTKASIAKAIELIAVDLYNRIVDKTPVDTGKAKANWNMSVDSVDTTVTDSTTRKLIGSLGGISPNGDSTVWITNHLHYIYELEHGRSGQAPSGMVLVSIPETIQWINSKLGVA
jgi:hypothetical protein